MITTFLCFSPPIASKEKHNPTRILNLGYIHLYVFFTHWRFGALQQWLHALFETLFFHCLRFLLYIGLLTRKVLPFALHFLRLATRLLVRTSDGSEANQCFFLPQSQVWVQLISVGSLLLIELIVCLNFLDLFQSQFGDPTFHLVGSAQKPIQLDFAWKIFFTDPTKMIGSDQRDGTKIGPQLAHLTIKFINWTWEKIGQNG